MLMMTDCAVNGGNSGGPIFNEEGNAIGAIVSGITRAEGMNFAISSDTIIDFLHTNNVFVEAKSFVNNIKNYEQCDRKCPMCGMHNVDYDPRSGIYWCTNCDYEF